MTRSIDTHQQLESVYQRTLETYLVKVGQVVQRLDPQTDRVQWGEVTTALRMLGEALGLSAGAVEVPLSQAAADPLADLRILSFHAQSQRAQSHRQAGSRAPRSERRAAPPMDRRRSAN